MNVGAGADRAAEVSAALIELLGNDYDVAVRAEQGSDPNAFGLAIDITASREAGAPVYPLWLTPDDWVVRFGVARGMYGYEVLSAIADCARRALRRKAREQEIDDDPVRALRLQPGDLILVHASGRNSTRAAIESVQKLQQRTGHLTLLVPNGMDLETLPEEGARKLYEKLHARFGAPSISRAEKGAAEDLLKAPFFRKCLGVPYSADETAVVKIAHTDGRCSWHRVAAAYERRCGLPAEHEGAHDFGPPFFPNRILGTPPFMLGRALFEAGVRLEVERALAAVVEIEPWDDVRHQLMRMVAAGLRDRFVPFIAKVGINEWQVTAEGARAVLTATVRDGDDPRSPDQLTAKIEFTIPGALSVPNGIPVRLDSAMPPGRVELCASTGVVVGAIENIGDEKREMARAMKLDIERATFGEPYGRSELEVLAREWMTARPLFGVSLVLGLQGLQWDVIFQKATGEIVPLE